MQCTRTLYSEKILRINDYETQRMRVPHNQFNTKRMEFALSTNNTDAIMQGTKIWIHAMNKIHCQMAFPLLQRCLRYIYKHQMDESKDKFNFGPPVMRMMHFFNTPENALQVNWVTNWNTYLTFLPRLICSLFPFHSVPGYLDTLRSTSQWYVFTAELHNNFRRFTLQQWHVPRGCECDSAETWRTIEKRHEHKSPSELSAVCRML